MSQTRDKKENGSLIRSKWFNFVIFLKQIPKTLFIIPHYWGPVDSLWEQCYTDGIRGFFSLFRKLYSTTSLAASSNRFWEQSYVRLRSLNMILHHSLCSHDLHWVLARVWQQAYSHHTAETKRRQELYSDQNNTFDLNHIFGTNTVLIPFDIEVGGGWYQPVNHDAKGPHSGPANWELQ